MSSSVSHIGSERTIKPNPCNNDDCEKAQPKNFKTPLICFFWANGGCQKPASECFYLHENVPNGVVAEAPVQINGRRLLFQPSDRFGKRLANMRLIQGSVAGYQAQRLLAAPGTESKREREIETWGKQVEAWAGARIEDLEARELAFQNERQIFEKEKQTFEEAVAAERRRVEFMMAEEERFNSAVHAGFRVRSLSKHMITTKLMAFAGFSLV